MLAIAGSNGGCGKTTTALGLARAFAGPEAPALVVDADRQLPDLHATAGVDRAPTVAALDPGEDPLALAQPAPDLPCVRVLPGPKPDESVDVAAALEGIDTDARLLVDCPSGIGPDLTDPLTTADRAVVVVEGDADPAEARTTVDIARRLDVPVAGVVATKTAAVPEGVGTDLDAPALAAVPDAPAPLTDDDALAAYRSAAAALDGTVPPTSDDPDPSGAAGASAPERIPTGVDALDALLGGGPPPGSVVALVADPASRAEALLHRLPAARGTLYVSTDRPASLVRSALAADPDATAAPTIRTVGADPIGGTRTLLSDLPAGATLVVDPVDALEADDHGAYADFLDALAARMAETDGLAVLHCPRGPETRARALTLRAADVVVTLRAVEADGRVEQRLAVTACRSDPGVTGVTTLSHSDSCTSVPHRPPDVGRS